MEIAFSCNPTLNCFISGLHWIQVPSDDQAAKVGLRITRLLFKVACRIRRPHWPCANLLFLLVACGN